MKKAINKYRKGANKERQVVKELREKGYTAARSASSKSKVDIWAVNENEVLLIQCKHSTSNITKEIRELKQIKAPKNTRKLLYIFENYKPVRIYEVD